MTALGMCPHNNMSGYCPSCERIKNMNHARLRRQGMSRLSGMGDCQPGYYELKVLGFDTGQCAPNLSTVETAAGAGVTSAVGTGVANSSGTQAAVSSAAASAFGTSVMNFYKNNTAVAIGVTVAVGALLVYGGMSFLRGK